MATSTHYNEIKQRLQAQGGAEKTGAGSKRSDRYNAIKSRLQQGGFSTDVDERYIDSFLKDAKAYAQQLQQDYDGLSYATATSKDAQASRAAARDDLTTRAGRVRTYLNANKGRLDAGTYNNMISFLDGFSDLQTRSINAFREKEAYYSQWEAEEDYNAAVAEQKAYEDLIGFDIEAGTKEIKRLERIYNEYSVLTRSMLNDEYQKREDEIRRQYGDLDELEALISEKKAYMARAKRLKNGIALASVAGNEDFDTYKGYVSTKSDGWWDELTSKYGMGYDDLTYEYINNQNGLRDEILRKTATWNAGGDSLGKTLDLKIYDHMNTDEVAIYNYYYATKGKKAAEEYLDSIRETLNYRSAQERFGKIEDNTALELLFGVEAGLDQFGSGIASLFNGDDYIVPSATQMMSGMVREDLEDAGPKLPKWLGGASLGQVGYDTITTTSNMVPSILTSTAVGTVSKTLGAWVGNALMASSAAGNAYQEMLNQGYTREQSASYGVIVGLSEATLERVLGGITALGGKGLSKTAVANLSKVDNVLSRFARSVGGDLLIKAGKEAVEEGVQSILEPYFKTIVTGEDFTVDMEEVLYSALMGLVTGGVFEGVPAATTTITKRISDSISGKKNMAAEAAGKVTQQGAPEVSAGVQSVAGKDTSAVKTPFAVASAPAQADVAAIVRNDRTVETGSAKTDNATLKTASKKYGAQAAVMEQTYQQGQDVERFDREFKLAYDMGKEGASRELMDGGAFAYLTAEQKNTAYQSGAAAAENAGIVAEAVKSLGITGEHAGVLTQSFNANQINAKDYAMGLQEAYEAGKVGVPLAQAGSHAAKLTDVQWQIAYKQGQKASGRQVAKQQAQARKNRSAGGADTSKGKVLFEGDRSSLNKTQRASVDAMEVLAKTLGVQFYVENLDGTKNANKNGWYDPKDGSIHINLNAGAGGKGTMLFTVAHELTHFIRQWSPAKFRALANFLVKRYGEQGVPVSDLIDAQIAGAKADNRDLTREEALEEVVADSMETMLSDGSVIEMMAELKQRDQSLWQKICDWFKDLAGKLQAVVDAYKGVEPDSTEGRMVADMKDMIGTLQALYMDALVDASENFDAGVQKITTEDSGGVKYQARPSIKSPDVLDPKTVTRADVAEMLEGVKAGKYAENSYIPVRISTPGIVQERLFASDIPIIMPVSKVAQALKEDSGAVKGKNIRGHGLSPEQLIDIIERMDSPDHVYAQNNGRGVEVIRLGVDSNNIVVIVEFDNNVNPAYMNGYEGGVYNVSVTAFNVDGGDVGLFMYSQEKGWREVFNKQKEGDPAKKFPATRPFAIEQDSLKDNVSQRQLEVNKEFSNRDSVGNQLSEEQQEYFKDSAVRDNDGRLLVLYHQTDGDFTIFDTRHPGAGSRDNGTPFGIFMKRSAGDIGLAGKKQMALYANITNPLRATNREDLTRKLCEISERYASISDQHKKLDAEYREKFEQAKKAWVNYITEWRSANPGASRNALSADPKFNELYDAEDNVVDEWTAAADRLSAQAKEAITEDLRKAGYDGVFLAEDVGSSGA